MVEVHMYNTCIPLMIEINSPLPQQSPDIEYSSSRIGCLVQTLGVHMDIEIHIQKMQCPNGFALTQVTQGKFAPTEIN